MTQSQENNNHFENGGIFKFSQDQSEQLQKSSQQLPTKAPGYTAMFQPLQVNKQSAMQLHPPASASSGHNNDTDSLQNEIMIVNNSSMVLLGSSNTNGKAANPLKTASGATNNNMKVSDSISANNSSMNAYQLNFGIANTSGAGVGLS